MPPQDYELVAPGIGKMVASLGAIVRQDATLRAEQAKNAPVASGFDQQGFQGVGGVTGNTVYSINEAQAASRLFYQLVITFDAGSGSGRYRIDGPQPSPAVGIPIPAGGVTLTITGANNIQAFRMIAEAGQILTFARNLFV